MAKVESLYESGAGEGVGNSEEVQILKDLVYCTKVFGIYPEGSGKPEKIIKQGSDTI